MSITCVVGINWGDEGKGRMVDFLARDADIVARYQGGNNAGHTIVNEHGTFKLHLIPSGIFNPGTINVLGPGMVIDLERLAEEIDGLRAAGFDAEIRVSERATICFPFHREEDALEEDRLAERSYGSTRRGIAPAYGDRYLKKAVQLGELADEDRLAGHVREIVEWKNVMLRGRDHEVSAEDTVDWVLRHGRRVQPLVDDTCGLIGSAVEEGKRVIFEAQLGALRDVYFGTVPFTSSSGCLAPHALIGPGLSGRHPDAVVGVMKAFATCVGEGPFPTEMDGTAAHELRESSGEYGTATGRPRRIGHFDAVASRYGVELQGPTSVALTKLDSLSGQRELRICRAYARDGRDLDRFPINPVLEAVEPVYETLPGWPDDISGARRLDDLPPEARRYVERIEELIGCRIGYISVGPERDALIVR